MHLLDQIIRGNWSDLENGGVQCGLAFWLIFLGIDFLQCDTFLSYSAHKLGNRKVDRR